jgi:MFS family permease
MGLIGAAFGLGFICGPALGGLFNELGPTVPAYVAAGLSALNWVLALFLLPETHPVHRHRGTPFEAQARVAETVKQEEALRPMP